MSLMNNIQLITNSQSSRDFGSKSMEQMPSKQQEELNRLKLELIQKNILIEKQGRLIQEREKELEYTYTVLAQQQQHFELISNHSPTGIAYIDVNKRYTYTNATYQEWLGLDLFQTLGVELQKIWHQTSLSILENLMDELNTIKRITTENYFLFPNNEQKYIIQTLCIDKDDNGKIMGYFHFIEDIIHLKQAQDSLKNNNQKLVKEIKKRRETAEKLEFANGELRHFAYAVAHDLKEPIRTINSFSKILLQRYEAMMPNECKSLINLMASSSGRVSVMIKDLLDYATMDKKLVETQEVDLNDTIMIVEHYLKAAIEESEATIEYSNLPKIQAHQTLITQLFQNIISNAIKFRKSDVLPIISIASFKTQGFHKINITDNGIGISEEYFDNIFGVFNKLHKSSEYSGSGIGLATCKKIVELYGGKIEVKSALRMGTTFSIFLPE